jgi:hypothetical protein
MTDQGAQQARAILRRQRHGTFNGLLDERRVLGFNIG